MRFCLYCAAVLIAASALAKDPLFVCQGGQLTTDPDRFVACKPYRSPAGSQQPASTPAEPPKPAPITLQIVDESEGRRAVAELRRHLQTANELGAACREDIQSADRPSDGGPAIDERDSSCAKFSVWAEKIDRFMAESERIDEMRNTSRYRSQRSEIQRDFDTFTEHLRYYRSWRR